MKTKKTIEYKVAGTYFTAIIPAGVTCDPAKNLPDYKEKGLYWARGWRGMSKESRHFKDHVGFLLTRQEIKGLE